MSLTKEQLLVQDTRGKNMLVSAAAGSGKTFVLVKRILSEILDKKNGIDIDEILVVTFTTAAAAEMKDRIRRAIDKAILEEGADKRIKSQATLIHNAHIRTIDSFCNWVVNNYFYEIDMDPSFRLGTNGELKMLSENVFTDLLSSYLEEGDADFKFLADAYINGRRTDALRDMVFELYEKAQSFAWPDEWYEDSLKLYQVESLDALKDSEFVSEVLKITDIYLQEIVERLRRLVSLYSMDCDSKDKTIFTSELNMLNNVLSATTFEEKYSAIQGADFSTRFASKGTCLNEDELEAAKELRGSYKDIISKLKEDYYSMPLDEVYQDILVVKRQVNALIDFTKSYAEALLAEKKKRNIYSFNDIEHMALEILRVKDSKEHEKRPVAIELSNHFKEIMVDEYQDSNELQEQILTAICNGNNYFTVGDVKQSIYAFRQASPALFIEKLYSYPTDGNGNSIRIDLDKNFRSRNQVLEFTNQVFEPLMQMDVGGVKYDDKAALKLGDETFKGSDTDYESEILIATQNTDDMRELEIENGDELEALTIAKRIKELKSSDFQVSYKEDDERKLRSMKYSDVVILMRGLKGHSDKFIATLKDLGIPAYVAEEKGFFDREEVDTVLSMLQVVDNPYNDIPLAAVLHSPMFGFSSERLAQIRATNPKVSLYECILQFNDDNASDLAYFLSMLKQFRDEAIDTPIHEVIEHILKDTGYDIYVKSLSNGRMASANINKLIDEAVSFEGSSFKGLSRFVHYIEGLKYYEEDLGLAKTIGENDDAVRIMSIHKSKGLEYPVVFLAGCGRTINSESGNLCYDNKMGLALNYRNPDTRITYKTPLYNVVKFRTEADDRGEYLRILYVALTRAVDKLIITGAIKPSKKTSVPDKIASYSGEYGSLGTYTKLKATTSLELIIRALNASGSKYQKRIIDCQELFIDEVQKAIAKEQTKKLIRDYVDGAKADDNPIAQVLDFKYQGLKDSSYKSKYSVSEIKHQAMEDAFSFNQDAMPAFIHQDEESYVPMFMREDVATSAEEPHVNAGALYGTAMHRFLECYDFAKEELLESFDNQLDYMKSIHCMSDDEFARISIPKLKKFLKDQSAVRMAKAAINDKLYKEQPFVFGGDAKELFDDNEASDELILVQGIIDVFWEEPDGIVLLDYKTDRVDEEQELMLRYERQLQLYKEAIQRAYGKQVKEVLIYSFALERSIELCTTK